MNVILFGFKGAGKTHFGKLLAKRLNRLFIDTDDLIRDIFFENSGENVTVPEIYIKLGERDFRSLETQAVLSLATAKNAIIAVGGGAVLNAGNVKFLQKIGILVYLYTPIETIRGRLAKDRTPSFLQENDLENSFFQMTQERLPVYESIPAVKVRCDLLDESGVLLALEALLR